MNDPTPGVQTKAVTFHSEPQIIERDGQLFEMIITAEAEVIPGPQSKIRAIIDEEIAAGNDAYWLHQIKAIVDKES